ncbi:MAG: antibiotic biosynthesis monooxygenase [Thalassobaculaceae bacterium]
MPSDDTGRGPILRLFEVRTKPNGADTLLAKFATTSAAVVQDKPGNQGYFFGRVVGVETDAVVFASIWKDLDAIKQHFGDDWRTSFLPEGYGDLIEECSVRHIDLSGGWHVSGDG